MAELKCTQDDMDDIIDLTMDNTKNNYELLSTASCINEKYFEYTLLMIAVLYDNVKAVEQILNNSKVNINETANKGQTALILACMKEEDRLDIQENIDDLQETSDNYEKLRAERMTGGKYKSKKSKVKRSQRGGALNANSKIIKLLLNAGADVNIEDESEKTAMDYYKKRPDEKVDKEINKFFIDKTDLGDIKIELDGGRKRRKSRKQRKSRKTRKHRKTRKQRKTRR